MDKITTDKQKQVEKQTEKLNIKLNVNETVDSSEIGSVSEEKFVVENSPENIVEEAQVETRNSYIDSFKNMTVSDVRELQAEEIAKETLDKKEELIAEQFEVQVEEEKPENIIEKPNYDLLEENKKIVKLKKNTKEKKKRKTGKKVAGIALALSLAISGIICVVNTILIDTYSAQFLEIEDKYNFNLLTYLRNISNLDTTKESMELFDTYPEEVLEAGEQNEQTNWFDRICNFFGNLFGG